MIYLFSLAKSANVGFEPVVQLYIPPTNHANAPRAENHFINSEKNIVGVNNVRTNIRV